MKRLLVFGILLLGLVLVGCTQVQQTQDDLTEKWMPQKARSCIDTDQVPPTNTGHDSAAYGIKGTTISTGVVAQKRTDSCAADGKLLEYYCENKAIKSETYACPNGCKDGACASTPTVTPTAKSCSPSYDSAKRIYNNSKIYINGNEFREYCRDANTKLELWCKSSTESGTEWVTCENGCSNGACAATPTVTPTATPTPNACTEAGGTCGKYGASCALCANLVNTCPSGTQPSAESSLNTACKQPPVTSGNPPFDNRVCCVPKSNPTATPTPTPSATPTATATATPTPTPTATPTPAPGTYVACGTNNAGMCYKSANYDGTNRHYGCPLGLQQLTEATKECSSLGAYCCKQPAAGSCESVNGICNAGQPFYPTVCSWTQFSRAPDSATGSCSNNELCCRPSDEAYRVSAAVKALATPTP